MHTDFQSESNAHLSLEAIRAALAGFSPETHPSETAERVAAVAMVLRPGADGGLEVLFMKRSEREGDPWSGQMAFPGGHVESSDTSIEAAARRECQEEVGLVLAPDMQIGRLSDIAGGRLRTFELAVCPVVYYCPEPGALTHNYEVAATVWVPLSFLSDANNIEAYYYPLDPEQRPFSCFNYGPYTIWGLTYRILAQFMGLFAIELPTELPLTDVE
ncbi:MAG: CoA pyrophosphatase [Candidatus Hydrogenedentes bacterium]|nr:CoA pyrophosphatase [Candidatus Hydrogenedentota bacterium]